MSYVVVLFNHFRALQRWAAGSDAQLHLDVKTYQLEVKWRNRYYHLVPQFVAMTDGRLSHAPTLTDSVIGFAGWLPYRPCSVELAKDKLLFKQHLTRAGLRTPKAWPSAAEAETDFVLKRSMGSFGLQLAGPFRVASKDAVDPQSVAAGAGTVYAEQFVQGAILKAWCWGAKPFFAHVQTYPTITGDGATPLGELVQQRVDQATGWPRTAALATAQACASYQGFGATDVVPAMQEVWIDFRYGRTYASTAPASVSDNALGQLAETTRQQIASAGECVNESLREKMPVPVAYALDGMIDLHGDIWWLEMNSNPVFPAEGYAAMLGDLFA